MLESLILSEELTRDEFVMGGIEVVSEIVIECNRINHIVINVRNLTGEIEAALSDVLNMFNAVPTFVTLILRENVMMEIGKEMGIYLHKYMITLTGRFGRRLRKIGSDLLLIFEMSGKIGMCNSLTSFLPRSDVYFKFNIKPAKSEL